MKMSIYLDDSHEHLLALLKPFLKKNASQVIAEAVELLAKQHGWVIERERVSRETT